MKPLFRLIFASGALLAAKSALMGIRILVLLLIAAYGRETGLASAAFAVSLAEIGRWIADFGTDTWNIRAIALARNANDETRLLTAALLIKTVGSVLVGASIVVVCHFKLPSAGNALGFMAVLLLMTSQVAGLAIAYFQAKNSIALLAPMLIPCAATVLAVFLGLMLTGRFLIALGIMTAGEICIAAMLLAMLRRRVSLTKFSRVRADAVHMAHSCIPAAALGIAVGVYSRIDTLVLAEFSVDALAVYTVAQRLFQPFQVAATSFGSIVYSRASLSASGCRAFARQFLRHDMPIILACAIACSLALFVGGRLLIENAFPQYPTARGLLSILCALLPLLAFNSAMTGLLLGYGRYWTVLSVAVLDLLLTCIVMILLVPGTGASGTAESLFVGGLADGAALALAAFAFTRSHAERAQSGSSPL